MTDEVRPLGCPFCGAMSSDIGVAKTYDKVKVICLKCSAEFTLASHFRNEKQAVVNAWNTRAAYEAEGYFFLPKPKEQLFYTTPLGIKETENGYMAQTAYQIIEEAARRWAREIDDEILRRIIECWNTRAERTCQRVNKPDQFFADNLEYSVDAYRCSVCNFRLDRITNYCPNCGAKVAEHG